MVRKYLRVPSMVVALMTAASTAQSQQAPDSRIADLVRAGRVRVALFLPQYTKDGTRLPARPWRASTPASATWHSWVPNYLAPGR